MAKIKYMGLSDRKVVPKGTDFGGRLAVPLDREVVWDWDNKHIVDTGSKELSGVPDTVWELLLEEQEGPPGNQFPAFKDVTGMDRIPVNRAQKTWKGMSDKKTESAAEVVGEASSPDDEEDEDDADGEKPVVPGSVSEVPSDGARTTGRPRRTGPGATR